MRQPSLKSRLAVAVLAIWALSFSTIAQCQASTGTLSRLNGFGLNLDIDTRWPPTDGYRPVRLRLSPSVPQTANRTLNVKLSFGNYSGAKLETEATIELPAGATAAEVELLVPIDRWWQTFDVETFEAGRARDKLSSDYLPVSWNFDTATFTHMKGIAVTDPGFAPDLLNLGLSQSWPVEAATPAFFSTATNLATVTNQSQFGPLTYVSSVELPTNWLAYSGLDFVVVSREQLSTIMKTRPKVFHSLRKFARSGGALYVYGVAHDEPTLASLAKDLGVASDAAWDATWQVPNPAVFEMSLPALANQGQPYYGPTGQLVQPMQMPADAALVTLDPNAPPPFRFAAFGAGAIVAIIEPDATKIPVKHWRYVVNSLPYAHRTWGDRLGSSVFANNNDYYNFLVPGVGEVPVTMFRVVITLFVILTGPVNYVYLKRIGKLHLLLFIVPAVAVFITMGLFAYAFLVDGFDTKVRARSITMLDQKAGEATTYARLCYYAGLSPANGLRFTEDTVVAQVNVEGADPYSYNGGTWKKFQFAEAEPPSQRFEAGFLPSRVNTQFMQARQAKSVRGVRLESEPGSPVRVKNELGGEMLCIVWVDEQGSLHLGDSIANGISKDLTPVDKEVAKEKLQSFVSAAPPALPMGFDSNRIDMFGQRRMYYGLLNANASSALLESKLRAIDLFPPKSYVAIVDESPDVEFGLEGVTEVSSLHVIVGTW